MTTMTTKTLAVTIDAPLFEVADFLAVPANHPTWGTEFFAGSATELPDGEIEGEVEVQVPMMGGLARMHIKATTELGVIDLYLAPLNAPYGAPLPIRVIPNGTGCDVLFTLARFPGQPDEQWTEGISSMDRELQKLRARW